MVEKQCKGCGTLFMSSRTAVLYCSPKCVSPLVKCAKCNLNFRTSALKIKTNKNFFCSLDCRDKSRVGKNHPMYGKKWSKESREKLSKTRRHFFAIGKIRLWMTEEHKQKIREALTGKKRPPYSKEWIDNMCKSRTGEKNHFYGKSHSEETKQKLSKTLIGLNRRGEKCVFWKGGISFEPYDTTFNKQFKEEIKNRDDYVCQICEDKTKKMDVHHIDYNKLNSIKENCILLCGKCHTKTNHRREQWKQFFWSLLNEKYGYEYEGRITIEQYSLFKIMGFLPKAFDKGNIKGD